jgi:hypothetical protein
MADPGFQHRVFLKINYIQRYKKYIISTHIYQYILAFSIENRPEHSQEYRSTCERHCIQLDYQKIKLKNSKEDVESQIFRISKIFKPIQIQNQTKFKRHQKRINEKQNCSFEI